MVKHNFNLMVSGYGLLSDNTKPLHKSQEMPKTLITASEHMT